MENESQPQEIQNLNDLIYEIEDLGLQERFYKAMADFSQWVQRECTMCEMDRLEFSEN